MSIASHNSFQKAKGPAATAIAPDHGSNIPQEETKMNEATNTTGRSALEVCNAADDVNRAKAVVLTVWLALQSPDLLGGCEGDVGAIADTLYEAVMKLSNAEKALGVHS
jgi:hypothetical protein